MAKKQLFIRVEKRGKEFVVVFGFGVQSFELAYGGTKSEAQWMAKMLRYAFAQYRKSVVSPKS